MAEGYQEAVDRLKLKLRTCPQSQVPDVEFEIRGLQRRIQKLLAEAGEARREEERLRQERWQERFIQEAKALLPPATFQAIMDAVEGP
jgi:hypothetical protein